MARPPLPPILLGEVRAAGCSLLLICPICPHRATMPAERVPLPDHVDLDQVTRRLRCTGCGRRGGIDVVPDGAAWVRYLRATGQRDRWPWYAGMIREEPADRLLDLARNLGIEDETFARTLAEVMAKADADPERSQPHEVIAEVRARLLALATGSDART